MSSGDEPSLGVSGSHALDLRVVGAGQAGPVGLVLSGELDREEADKLLECVTGLVREHPGRAIEVDAGTLLFLDSGGVRALLTCLELAEAAGCRLSIVAAGPVTYQVLRITGLLETFGSPVAAPDEL
ncbi:hypothetical protein GCM10010168_63760 [Actinoplanes ianthinogenes]|uniref:STAS domain-containing protein n=1 Tax=Actinoplanes ianthinogenes TaxID=122358 RepID=A0ABM7LJF9_9ACTN|nr:STAS domain-containing protein [Actinoplanes ianthinogenes]BCJ39376.1 hypothetical protein Aiant_00330 [Actinoplanes ianthinogenes]GGR36551.1 hypothetical protein GCM10010168_63760 [Actinoplanes ianthinogenes]